LICCTFLDDKHVATGGVSGDLYIWDKSSHKIVQIVKKAHKAFLSDMTIFIQSGMFATVGGHKDNTLKIWQYHDGKVTPMEKYTKDFGFPLQAVKWDWDGARLAVGGDEGSILVHKVTKEGYTSEIVVQKAHDNSDLDKSEVWGLDFHPSNKSYVSASDDGSVRLWDVAKKLMLKRIDFPDEMIRDCAFSPNGQFLAVGTRKGTVYIVDGTTLKILHTPVVPNDAQVLKKQEMSLAWYPSGRFLAVGKGDGSIELHAIDGAGNLTMFHKFTGHSGNVQTMDFSADGALLRSYSRGTRNNYEVLFCKYFDFIDFHEKQKTVD
jgi:WD40 repeat protein